MGNLCHWAFFHVGLRQILHKLGRSVLLVCLDCQFVFTRTNFSFVLASDYLKLVFSKVFSGITLDHNFV